MADLTPERLTELRREVREWMCDGCNAVYPGPPQPGIWCVQCPRCGGDTAPRSVIERRRLEQEIEWLRQIEAAARTLVDTAFEVPGHDEHVYQAVRVDHFDMLVALLKGEGGASDA